MTHAAAFAGIAPADEMCFAFGYITHRNQLLPQSWRNAASEAIFEEGGPNTVVEPSHSYDGRTPT